MATGRDCHENIFIETKNERNGGLENIRNVQKKLQWSW